MRVRVLTVVRVCCACREASAVLTSRRHEVDRRTLRGSVERRLARSDILLAVLRLSTSLLLLVLLLLLRVPLLTVVAVCLPLLGVVDLLQRERRLEGAGAATPHEAADEENDEDDKDGNCERAGHGGEEGQHSWKGGKGLGVAAGGTTAARVVACARAHMLRAVP